MESKQHPKTPEIVTYNVTNSTCYGSGLFVVRSPQTCIDLCLTQPSRHITGLPADCNRGRGSSQICQATPCSSSSQAHGMGLAK